VPKKLAAYYILFAISGFCGLIYESIWAKYLKLFLGHAAYAQTVVLIVFIGGMAIGAWLCGHFSNRIRQPLLFYAGAYRSLGAPPVPRSGWAASGSMLETTSARTILRP